MAQNKPYNCVYSRYNKFPFCYLPILTDRVKNYLSGDTYKLFKLKTKLLTNEELLYLFYMKENLKDINISDSLKWLLLERGIDVEKIKKLSKFRECQSCKHLFIVPAVTLLYESRYNAKIFCPKCESSNIAVIDEKLYNKSGLSN